MTARLSLTVLGSAAGGGVPQWNCGCAICGLARSGDARVRPRTQSSVAVSVDGERWAILNASPDLRQQIAQTPALHPRRGPRDSPIEAVLVTNGDVDHIAGLLTLREKQRFALYGTGDVLGMVSDNPVFDVLDRAFVERRGVALDRPVELLPGLVAELFAVPGKVPLYLENDDVAIGAETGTTVGARLSGGGATLAYVPGCADVNAGVLAAIENCDALLFDGTVFRDDEMIAAGAGAKTGRRMGHAPIAGPGGSLEALSGLSCRRVYIHVNNTNPILIEGSPERREVEAAGWEVAFDGMVVAP